MIRKTAGIFSIIVGISMILMWLMFFLTSSITELATGVLIYTMIQSPGYFLQTGEPGFVVMFAVLIMLALVILMKMLRSGHGSV